MKIDTRSRHRNSPRPPEKSAPAFLQWVRLRPCLLAGGQCAGKIEAAHVDYAGGKGMGTKVADRFAVPLCGAHHAESHNAGIQTFEARHNVDLLAASKVLWQAWPGRYKWEQERG